MFGLGLAEILVLAFMLGGAVVVGVLILSVSFYLATRVFPQLMDGRTRPTSGKS